MKLNGASALPWAWILWTLTPGLVAADEPLLPGPFQVPPAPNDVAPVLAGSVHLSMVFPIERGPLCPPGPDCLLGGGGGVGAVLERRWPIGVALGLGYDVWFLDGNGVYEIGVMQEVRVQVRWFLLRDSVVHPFVGAGGGALLFGDTFRVATVGISADILAGIEIELTEAISIEIGFPWRLFVLRGFESARDHEARSANGGLNVMAALQFGINVVQTP